MNPNREELLFQLALTKPAAERVTWLDRECGGDAALRARLDALLAAHEQPETLLATQAETARPTPSSSGTTGHTNGLNTNGLNTNGLNTTTFLRHRRT